MQDRISRSKNKKIITVSHFHLYFKCSSQNFTKNNKNIQAFELPLVIWNYVKLKKSNWNKYIFIYHTTLGNNYFKIRINSMSKLFPLNDFENGALLSFTYGHLYKSQHALVSSFELITAILITLQRKICPLMDKILLISK